MSIEIGRGAATRRGFIVGGALGLAGAASCAAPAALGRAAPGKRIDVHHHFVSKAYRDFQYDFGRNLPGGRFGPPPTWELSQDLEDMDKFGTGTAILSSMVGVTFGSMEQRKKLARDNNEAAAKLVADHPGRFGSFACLPVADMDACLTEVAYALDVLKADGIALYSNAGDKWLGHPDFEPLHAELNRRKAIVFVHPSAASCCVNIVKDLPDTFVEFGADTARAIGSLIFSGTTTRYPDIRFIFSHGGGVLPYVSERFIGNMQAELEPGRNTFGQRRQMPVVQPPAGALVELRKMFYDTAQCANPIAMGALKKLVPVSQILYGTDYWYRTAEETAANLLASGVFSRTELEAVGRTNALALLPRLRA